MRRSRRLLIAGVFAFFQFLNAASPFGRGIVICLRTSAALPFRAHRRFRFDRLFRNEMRHASDLSRACFRKRAQIYEIPKSFRENVELLALRRAKPRRFFLNDLPRENCANRIYVNLLRLARTRANQLSPPVSDVCFYGENSKNPGRYRNLPEIEICQTAAEFCFSQNKRRFVSKFLRLSVA